MGELIQFDLQKRRESRAFPSNSSDEMPIPISDDKVRLAAAGSIDTRLAAEAWRILGEETPEIQAELAAEFTQAQQRVTENVGALSGAEAIVTRHLVKLEAPGFGV